MVAWLEMVASSWLGMVLGIAGDGGIVVVGDDGVVVVGDGGIVLNGDGAGRWHSLPRPTNGFLFPPPYLFILLLLSLLSSTHPVVLTPSAVVRVCLCRVSHC
ncbi:hypothetical protein EDD22DRAFT_962794 [Suillus occidentalis]|nr:hypothetical protein EDD22DRAFT_962794 [Suillus occidentalis]